MIRFVASLAVGMSLLLGAGSFAALAEDGPGEVRVTGACGGHMTSKLRLKRVDDGIEVRFEVDYDRAGVLWRVALVHERRIAWKGTATTRSGGSFEVRRTLRDLPGADALSAHAWGPRGFVCRAAATLPGG